MRNKEYPFPMRMSRFGAVIQHKVACGRCENLPPFIVLRAIDKGTCAARGTVRQ